MKNRLLSIFKAIASNWPMKIISLFIAMILWLVIVQYVNPDDTRRLENIKINLNIEGSVPEGEGLVLVTDFDESVSITYTASRDVIAVLNTDRITAYVDLSSATKSGEFNFPVKIDTGGQNINIVDQSVTEVTLKFETSYVAQVKVNVNFEGKVAEGYIRNDPVCVPSVINIEGPESKVNAIEAAEVTISEKEFSETQVYNCEYEFVDANGNTIDKAFVKTDVDAVQVSVAVMKTKTIPVTATLVNSSGGNENSYATLTIEPSTINIAGSTELLDTLNSYDLGTIDIADKEDDFEQTVKLSLQNGVVNIDGISSVDVKVAFGDVMTKTVQFENFTVQNVADGQNVKITDQSLSVTFRGIAADIAKINNENVSLTIDFQNKSQSSGVSSFPVYAVIPEGLQVGVSGKYYVTAEVSS